MSYCSHCRITFLSAWCPVCGCTGENDIDNDDMIIDRAEQEREERIMERER